MEFLRRLIQEAVAEAIETPHYMDRVSERLFDPSLISPPIDPKYITPALNMLKLINFPPKVNLGVNIFRSGSNFRVLSADHDTTYEGNNIWVVIRDNELQTVMFLKDGVPPDHIRYQTTIAKLSRIVNEKGYDITVTDLEGKAPQKDQKSGFSLNLPVVNIRGQKWYFDRENNRFLYAKNVNKVLTLDDAFKTLPEEELDAILSQAIEAA